MLAFANLKNNYVPAAPNIRAGAIRMSDKFFQFPLCMLSMTGDIDTRADRITSFSTMKCGRKAVCEMTVEEQRNEIGEMDSDDLPRGFHIADREHRTYVIGMNRLVLVKGGMQYVLRCNSEACSHINRYEEKHGRDAEVRVKKNVIFDVRSGSMNWRDFSVLCAVYSLIGLKPYPVLIYRSMVQAQSMGFKSPSVAEGELKSRDDLTPLTEKQIRLTLDSLESAGWFARIQASARRVFYSHRMTREEMVTVLEKKYHAIGRPKRNREEDRDIQARLKKARAGGKA